MKKTLLGAFLGAIILFAWQFLSWGVINFHEKAQQYTPNEQAIMTALQENLPQEGGYVIPNVPPGASDEEMQRIIKDMEGKPWASIQYHNAHKGDMTMNSIRQFIVNFLTVWLFAWILLRFNVRSFGNIFLSALAVGLIIFFNAPYTGNIWYPMFDIWAHFLDAMVCWALIGILLAVLLRDRTAAR